MRITVLAGGVGSARFCAGLVRVVDPADLTIVVNVGDDERIRGLHLSPDLDTVCYHLAGLEDWERGWGLVEESYEVQRRYVELAARAGLDADLQDWFTLGDRDIALNMLRTRLLDTGHPLSEATAAIARALGIACRVLPVTDDAVRTKLRSASGELLDFQEYFVHRRQRDEVTEILVDGAPGAAPAPGVVEAIVEADVVIVPPSNPLISVEPLLAVGTVRDVLRDRGPVRVAVSPIISGRALKGPADLLMRSLGHDVSALGVARLYAGTVDVFVLDAQDAPMASAIGDLGLRPVVGDTIMRSPEDAARVAKAVVDAL